MKHLLLFTSILLIVAVSTTTQGVSAYFGYRSSSRSNNDEVDASNNNNMNDPYSRRHRASAANYFRRLRDQPQDDDDEEKHQQKSSSGPQTGHAPSSSFFSMDEADELIALVSEQDKGNTNDDDGKKKKSQLAVGVGSVTSSVLGPHTSREEATTQRRLSKENSVPAKLLREWELKGAHHPCWKRAVLRLKSVCEDILSNKQKRTRLALEFMFCQLELDGKQLERSAQCDFSDDDEETAKNAGTDANVLASCAATLPEALYLIKVQFDHHVDTLCFHIQEELLHERTKAIVDRLGVAGSQAARNLAELSLRSGQIDQSMQLLHGSQKQAVASAETLAFALQQVNKIGVDIKLAMEDERVGMETVSQKVQSLLETHETMKSKNQELAESLKILTDTHVRAVGQLGTEVDSTRRKLLAGMEGLTSLQAKTSRFIGSLDAAIHYVFVFFLLWIVTTSSRTHDARFPALVVGPISSIIAERYFLRGFLKMFSMLGLCTNPDLILEAHEYRSQHYSSSSSPIEEAINNHQQDQEQYFSMMGSAAGFAKTSLLLDPTPVRNFFIVTAFLCVALSAFLYQSPEERQRKILQIELGKAINRALGKEDDEDKINNNGSGKNDKRAFSPRLVSSMERSTEGDDGSQDSTSVGSMKKKRGSSSKK